jgi:hypothetical protein
MATTDKLLLAFQHFDAANKQDPNTEVFQGRNYPKEVLYAMRMTERLNIFSPMHLKYCGLLHVVSIFVDGKFQGNPMK